MLSTRINTTDRVYNVQVVGNSVGLLLDRLHIPHKRTGALSGNRAYVSRENFYEASQVPTAIRMTTNWSSNLGQVCIASRNVFEHAIYETSSYSYTFEKLAKAHLTTLNDILKREGFPVFGTMVSLDYTVDCWFRLVVEGGSPLYIPVYHKLMPFVYGMKEDEIKKLKSFEPADYRALGIRKRTPAERLDAYFHLQADTAIDKLDTTLLQEIQKRQDYLMAMKVAMENPQLCDSSDVKYALPLTSTRCGWRSELIHPTVCDVDDFNILNSADMKVTDTHVQRVLCNEPTPLTIGDTTVNLSGFKIASKNFTSYVLCSTLEESVAKSRANTQLTFARDARKYLRLLAEEGRDSALAHLRRRNMYWLPSAALSEKMKRLQLHPEKRMFRHIFWREGLYVELPLAPLSEIAKSGTERTTWYDQYLKEVADQTECLALQRYPRLHRTLGLKCNKYSRIKEVPLADNGDYMYSAEIDLLKSFVHGRNRFVQKPTSVEIKIAALTVHRLPITSLQDTYLALADVYDRMGVVEKRQKEGQPLLHALSEYISTGDESTIVEMDAIYQHIKSSYHDRAEKHYLYRKKIEDQDVVVLATRETLKDTLEAEQDLVKRHMEVLQHFKNCGDCKLVGSEVLLRTSTENDQPTSARFHLSTTRMLDSIADDVDVQLPRVIDMWHVATRKRVAFTRAYLNHIQRMPSHIKEAAGAVDFTEPNTTEKYTIVPPSDLLRGMRDIYQPHAVEEYCRRYVELKAVFSDQWDQRVILKNTFVARFLCGEGYPTRFSYTYHSPMIRNSSTAHSRVGGSSASYTPLPLEVLQLITARLPVRDLLNAPKELQMAYIRVHTEEAFTKSLPNMRSLRGPARLYRR